MTRSQKITGRTSSLPAGLAAGAAVNVGITAAGTGLLANLLNRESVNWENIGYGVLIMILLAAYLGSLVAYGRIRRQKLMICMMSGLLYFGILLLITALFFGGQYEAVGVTGLLITGGSGCAALTGTGWGKGTRRTRKKYHHR